MEKLQLLGKICTDLSHDKEMIIKKYVLPLLDNLIENIPCVEFDIDYLHSIFGDCLGDVMNLLQDGHIACLLEQNKLGVSTIHEYKEKNWSAFNNYGKCNLCEKMEILNCCGGDHHDECEYSSISSESCGTKLCDECIHLDCLLDSNQYCEVKCEAIRCENCAF